MIPGLVLPQSNLNLSFLGSVRYRELIKRYGFDPFMIMPPNAQWIDEFASRTVAAAGGTADVFNIEIGGNEWVRISNIGMEADANAVVGISDLVYSLRINDSPSPLMVLCRIKSGPARNRPAYLPGQTIAKQP